MANEQQLEPAWSQCLTPHSFVARDRHVGDNDPNNSVCFGLHLVAPEESHICNILHSPRLMLAVRLFHEQKEEWNYAALDKHVGDSDPNNSICLGLSLVVAEESHICNILRSPRLMQAFEEGNGVVLLERQEEEKEMTNARVALGKPVGDSDLNNSVCFGLQLVAPGKSHICRPLCSPHQILEMKIFHDWLLFSV